MFDRPGCIAACISTLILCLCFLPVGIQAQQRGSPANNAPPAGDPLISPPSNASTFEGYSGGTKRAEDEARVDFKSESVLIQVPVVIADKSGNHILNLKQDDFQIFENGKEQKITAFEEVVANKLPLSAVKSRPGEFSNLATAQSEPPRSIVVVALDTVNTPVLDQTYARKQLLKYLARNLDSNQIFGLVIITSHGLKVIHGLTGDSRQLIEALNKVSSEQPAMTGVSIDAQVAAVSGDIPTDSVTLLSAGYVQQALSDFATASDAPVAFFKQERAIEATMQAFLEIAWSLSGLPGKKSVIWATGGLPFYLETPDVVPGGPGGDLSSLYERTMATLNESNISLYPLNVSGLLNGMAAADPSIPSMGINLVPGEAMQKVSDRSWLTTSTTETLKDFAAMTGGMAGYNSNDIAGLFKRAVDDSSGYYLLGYYLDTRNTKPGWRDLKVKLRQKNKDKNKDAEVRARSGFFVTNATMNPDIERKNDLDFAVLSPFDSTGLPLTVSWLGMSAEGVNGANRKVEFGLQLPSNALTLGPQNLMAFDYTAMAYSTKDGKQANSVGKTIQGNITPDRVIQIQLRGLGFKNELELAPGEYTVRFVVRDNVTGRVGSVTAPITVN
jgi:VWFA-related protein